MDFTSIDAIEFFQENKKHIRAYYQSDDGTIRESSFENGHGWFIRGDGIIASNAKRKSPITITRWNVGNETQIRLYYIDDQHDIWECQGRHTSSVTTWTSSVLLRNGNVAPGSQLTVARPDKDDTKLRVFYQEKPDANGKHPIREVLYYKGRHGRVSWQVQGARILGARENSHMSAISARNSKDVRLYYQGESRLLMESFWDNAGIGRWEKNDNLPTYQLAPKAPISAVCWYVGDDLDSSNLRIRIYTILESHPNEIKELSYQGGWDAESDSVAQDVHIGATQPGGQQIEYSAVATSRDTKADPYRPICVFYQPERNVINVIPIAADDGDEYITEAMSIVTPKGIPKSRGTARFSSAVGSPDSCVYPDPNVNPVPQLPNETGSQDQIAQLTTELAQKDAEIARLSGLLAAGNAGGSAPQSPPAAQPTFYYPSPRISVLDYTQNHAVDIRKSLPQELGTKVQSALRSASVRWARDVEDAYRKGLYDGYIGGITTFSESIGFPLQYSYGLSMLQQSFGLQETPGHQYASDDGIFIVVISADGSNIRPLIKL